MAAAVQSELKSARGNLETRRREVNEQLANRLRTLHAGPPPSKSGFLSLRRSRAVPQTPLPDELTAYAMDRLDDAWITVLQQFLDGVSSQVGTVAEQLNQLSRELKSLGTEFPASAAGETYQAVGGAETQAFVVRIRKALQTQRERITLAVHEELSRTALVGEQKLQRFVGVRMDVHEALKGPLLAAARRVVSDQVRESTLAWISESARDAGQGKDGACGRLVAEFLEERQTRVQSTLGPVLVLVPDTVEPRVLKEAFASCKDARLVPARTNGVTIMAEVGARPLEDVADELVQHQELYRQLAQKLHAREDVDWSPLPSPAKMRSDSAVAKIPAAPADLVAKASGSGPRSGR
jgi:hypothetical protein